jgi:hypothetical protein
MKKQVYNVGYANRQYAATLAKRLTEKFSIVCAVDDVNQDASHVLIRTVGEETIGVTKYGKMVAYFDGFIAGAIMA